MKQLRIVGCDCGHKVPFNTARCDRCTAPTAVYNRPFLLSGLVLSYVLGLMLLAA